MVAFVCSVTTLVLSIFAAVTDDAGLLVVDRVDSLGLLRGDGFLFSLFF